jgi:AcrR family transcriptional regulator
MPSISDRRSPAPVSRSDRSTVDQRRITATALRLFAERGYRATTMADIGSELGIRGPSLYKHVPSKQYLLGTIMVDTMRSLIAGQRDAMAAGGGSLSQLRRFVEAHVRYHALHRERAFVGNREIHNLTAPYVTEVVALRHTYEITLRELIEAGTDAGEMNVAHPRLISYAILDMGIGVASWFRHDGPFSSDQIAYAYGDIAARMVTDTGDAAYCRETADGSEISQI